MIELAGICATSPCRAPAVVAGDGLGRAPGPGPGRGRGFGSGWGLGRGPGGPGGPGGGGGRRAAEGGGPGAQPAGGRNPATGAEIQVAAQSVPKFRPGADFKALVNAGAKKPAAKAPAKKK